MDPGALRGGARGGRPRERRGGRGGPRANVASAIRGGCGGGARRGSSRTTTFSPSPLPSTSGLPAELTSEGLGVDSAGSGDLRGEFAQSWGMYGLLGWLRRISRRRRRRDERPSRVHGAALLHPGHRRRRIRSLRGRPIQERRVSVLSPDARSRRRAWWALRRACAPPRGSACAARRRPKTHHAAFFVDLGRPSAPPRSRG